MTSNSAPNLSLNPDRQAQFHQLLSDGLRHAPEYSDGFSNHHPMALHALFALGAPALAMQAFSRLYSGQLRPAAPREANALDPQTWQTCLGQKAQFTQLLAFFEADIADSGIESTLRMALPALWRGLHSGLLHGLIRAAHAMESGHAGEQAAALAYWACRWQALPAQCGSALGLDAWWKTVQDKAVAPASPGLFSAVLRAAESADYTHSALDLPHDAQGLRKAVLAFAQRAADLYAASHNFAALHVVTGCRAAWVLLPYVHDQRQAAQCISAALTAVMLTIKVANLKAAEGTHAPPHNPAAIRRVADQIFARLECGTAVDEHSIKLVHAAWQMDALAPHAAFADAAAAAWLDA